MKIKRKIKIFLPVFIIMTIMPVFAIYAGALSEAFFTLPGNGAVNKGDNFSINLTFSSTDNIGEINAKVAYDSNALEFTGGTDASGGGGVVIIKSTPGGSTDVSITLNFKGIGASRSAQLNIITCTIIAQDGSSIGSPMAYANVTVVDNGNSSDDSSQNVSETNADENSSQNETSSPDQSDQSAQTTEISSESETSAATVPSQTSYSAGRLSSLTVDNGRLEPDFSPDVFDYTVNVDYDVTNVELQATAANSSDYIWYSGTSECQVGENVRSVVVNDQYGNQTVYNIKVIRAEEKMVTTVKPTDKTMHIPQTKSQTEQSAFERDKSLITSAMIIVLIVLVIALVVIVFWIRNKITGNKSNKTNKKK